MRWFVGRWWTIPALAAAAVPVLWDMPAWWIDTPKGWRPDLTIYVYYLGFFLAGALLYRHRDLLPGIGRQLAASTGDRQPARPAAHAQADHRRELGGGDGPRPARVAGGVEGGGDLPRRALHLADALGTPRNLPALLRRQRGMVEVPRGCLVLVLSSRLPHPGCVSGLAGAPRAADRRPSSCS